MPVERINPDSLFKLDAFSQVVKATGGSGFAFIAGQGAFDANFQLVGAGDLRAQTVQACRNLRAAVEAAGSEPTPPARLAVVTLAAVVERRRNG